MKKVISNVLLLATIMCVVLSLCSCFATGVERAANKADKCIRESDEAGGFFGEAEYITSLEYFEETDTYIYTVEIHRPEVPVLNAGQISYGLHSNINGFFSDYDNVKIKIDVYNGNGKLVFEDK